MYWVKTHTSVLALVKGARERIAPCTSSPPLSTQPTLEGTVFPDCERSHLFPGDTQRMLPLVVIMMMVMQDDDGDADNDNDGDNSEDAVGD